MQYPQGCGLEREQLVRIRSASWAFSAQVLGVLVSLPMGILLARVLGASGKGTLTITQTFATMSAAVFNFGLGSALVYLAARREVHSRDAIRLSLGVAGLVSASLVLAVRLDGLQIAEALLHSSQVPLLYLGAVAAAPVLFSQLLGSYVIGAGSVRNASIVNISSLVFQLIAVAVLALFRALTPISAVIVWLCAILGASIALLGVARRTHSAAEAQGVRLLFVRGLNYALISWLSGSLALLSLRLDMFLVAYYLGPRQVGIYSIAVTLAELSWFIPNALNAVMVPKAAAEREASLDATLRLSRLAWPVTLVVASAVATVAVPVVPVLFGQAFAGALLPLALLVPGIVMVSVGSMPSAYNVGMGHPGDWTVASALNLACNLVLNIILLPRYGIAGAAIASSASYSVASMTAVWFFRHRSGSTLKDILVPRPDDFRTLWDGAVSVLRRVS